METPNLQTLFPGICDQSWLLRQISILCISSFVDINDVWDGSSRVFPKSSNWPGPGNESSQVRIYVASDVWYENKMRLVPAKGTERIQP